MKRKLILSTVLAVVLIAALSVTAFAASSISGPGSVENGETVTITVSTDAQGLSGLVSTQGLEVVSAAGGLGGADQVILLADAGGNTATFTCRVTGEPGSTVSFGLTGAKEVVDMVESDVSVPSWSATVAGAAPTDEPTQSPSEQPTQSPSGQPSGSAVPTGSTSAAPSGSAGNTDKMPKTADAFMDLWVLSVIAAGCTALAVVAGKKAFSHR